MTDTTMTNDFRALAMAALRIGGAMLETLTPEQQHAVDGALQGGARLSLEFGPLPDFDAAALVLVEREGKRHQLGSIAVSKGPIQ